MKTILVDAVGTIVLGDGSIFKEMHNLLEGYSNPKIILTNANDEQFDKFKLHDVPYPIFTLKHNPDKPDPRYFETFLKEYDLSVEEVIYFEHDENAVKTAKSLGIVAYHYDPEKKDLVALKEFLDSNL